MLRKLRRLREGRGERGRGESLERRRELAEAYGVRGRLDALAKACEIERKWRRRGLSLGDLLFYGEWSGLAAAEGLPVEDLFFDSRDWMNLMWLAGMPDDGSVSACEALERLRPRERRPALPRKRRGRRNVYLGRGCRSPPCVHDTGKPGLDNLREVEAIAKRILQDVKRGRISKRTAHGRFLLLYRLVSGKDRDFQGAKTKRAIAIVKRYWEKLRSL